ncbi:MAG: glycerophosphodiester phosphodiesterase [Clostridia bacterium]|nr:glycerophosphodiester phosphodiesterase [Clostridia bacterium]
MIPFFLTLLILLLLIFLAMLPGLGRREEMQVLRTNYAHRGLHDEALPENSRAAFSAAIEAGYGIEMDVRLTADKIPVVFHDDTLSRVCGAEGKVSQLTLEELRTARLGGTEEDIPTFAEFLSLVAGQVPLLIEIKGEDGNTEVCEKIAELLDNYDGLFSVQSFNPLYLRWFKLNRPGFLRGLLYTNFIRHNPGMSAIRKYALTCMLLNFLARPDFVAYHHLYPRELPLLLCRDVFNIPCLTWTVQDHEIAGKCHPSAAIIFEHFRPDR